MADENTRDDERLEETDLNTVRDILFGATTREHEQRFEELRNLWMSSLKEARGEFRERLDALETDTRKQARDILEKIELEHEAWQQRAIEMKQKLEDLYQDHENKLSSLRAMETSLLKSHQESLAQWLKRLETATGDKE